MITLIVRAIVSVLFIVAGLLKLRDAELTLISIYQYQLLSWESAGVLAATLPWRSELHRIRAQLQFEAETA